MVLIKKSMRKTVWKIFKISLIVFFILLISFHLFLITPPGNTLLKNIVQSRLENLISQSIHIDNLRTNFINRIYLQNITIGQQYQQSKPFLSAKSVIIGCDFWGLFNKKILIRDMTVDQPKINILIDSADYPYFPENLFRFIKDMINKSRINNIQLGNLKILDMTFNIIDLSDSIHVALDQINCAIHPLDFSEIREGELSLKNGRLNWKSFQQSVHYINAKFYFDKSNFYMTDFSIATDDLQLNSSACYAVNYRYFTSGKMSARFDLNLLNQFKLFDIKQQGIGEITIDCNFKGSIDQPDGFINLSFNQFQISNIQLDKISGKLSYKDKHLKLSDFSVESPIGKIQAEGVLDLTRKELDYQFDLALKNFQLYEITEMFLHQRAENIHGILNGHLKISGRADHWKKSIVKGEINMSQLALFSQPMEDIRSFVSLDNGSLKLEIKQQESRINFTGIIDSNDSLKGKFVGELTKLKPIAELVNLKKLNGKIQLDGNVVGAILSPSIFISFKLVDGIFQGLPLANVEGEAQFQNGQFTISNLITAGRITKLQPLTEHFPIDTLSGSLDYFISVQGKIDQLNAYSKIKWENGKVNQFNFDDLNLVIKAFGPELTIDEMELIKDSASVAVSGHVDLHEEISANINVCVSEIDSINKISNNKGLIKITGNLSNEQINAQICGDDISILPITTLLNLPENTAGNLGFESKIYGNRNHPNFNLKFNLTDLIYREKSLDTLHGEVNYADNLLSISKISASKESGNFDLQGEIPVNLYQFNLPSLANLKLEIKAENFGLDVFQSVVNDSFRIGGNLSAQLNFQGGLRNPEVSGKLQINNGSLTSPYFSDIDSLFLNTSLFGHDFHLETLVGKIKCLHFAFKGDGHYENQQLFSASFSGKFGQTGKIQIQGKKRPDQIISGQFAIENLNLNDFTKIITLNTQLKGLLNARLDVSGKADAPVASLNVASPQLGIENAMLDSVILKAQYQEDILKLTESGFNVNKGKIRFNGTIPINNIFQDRRLIKDARFDFSSYAENFDLDWLQCIIPKIDKLKGNLNYNLKIAGSSTEPIINGCFDLQSGCLKFNNIEPGIENLFATMHFEERKIDIERLFGNVHNGNFLLKGKAQLNGNEIDDTDLMLSLNKIKIQCPNLFLIGIEKGNLELTKSGEHLNLKGNIILNQTKYIQDHKPYLRKILKQIPGHAEFSINQLLNKTALDIGIQGQQNIWIVNNLTKVQTTSDLNLLGTFTEPRVSGKIVVNKGYILYLDRKFRITNGVIDFNDPQQNNPSIDLTSICTVINYMPAEEKKYLITLKLWGTVSQPELTLCSEPPLNKTDIIAVLTLGRTRESTSPVPVNTKNLAFHQVMINRFKEYNSQRIAGMTEQQLSRMLELQNISIEGNLFQINKTNGARIMATKKLMGRLNVTYSTVVGYANEQQVKLGYQLDKHFSIVGRAGQRGQSALDLKFGIKFR